MKDKFAIPEGIKFLNNYEVPSPIIQAITKDLMGRHEFGLAKYGVALGPNNGRNSFKDIYEEWLDAYNYTVNALLERGIDVGNLEVVPTWGPDGDSDTRILFELLTTTINVLKTLRGQFKCN